MECNKQLRQYAPGQFQAQRAKLSKKQWEAELMALHALMKADSAEYIEATLRLSHRIGVPRSEIVSRMATVYERIEHDKAVSENRLGEIDRNQFTNAILECDQLTDRDKVIALAVNSFAGGSNPYVFAGCAAIAKRAGGHRTDTTQRALSKLEDKGVVRRVKIVNLPPEVKEIAQRFRKDKRAVGYCLNDPSEWRLEGASESCPSATFGTRWKA